MYFNKFWDTQTNSSNPPKGSYLPCRFSRFIGPLGYFHMEKQNGVLFTFVLHCISACLNTPSNWFPIKDANLNIAAAKVTVTNITYVPVTCHPYVEDLECSLQGLSSPGHRRSNCGIHISRNTVLRCSIESKWRNVAIFRTIERPNSPLPLTVKAERCERPIRIHWRDKCSLRPSKNQPIDTNVEETAVSELSGMH